MKRVIVVVSLSLFMILPCAFASSASTLIKKEKVNKIAIFPLANYANEGSFVSCAKWKGSRKIVEGLSKVLNKRGIEVAEYDLTEKWLLFSGIIKPLEGVDKFGTPEYELIHSQHGSAFQEELFKKLSKRQEKTKALTQSAVSELGNKLGVDAVIRGAVYRYTIELEEEVAAFAGFLPFLIKGSQIGYATTERYGDNLYKPKSVPLLSENESILIIFLSAQNVKTGKVFWKTHFEIPYNEPNFSANLRERIAESIDPLFLSPNKGVVYSLKKK